MKSAAPKSRLLIVDNDKFMIKILEKLFEKVYEVRSTSSAEEALDLIESGFLPSVVISVNVLNGMRGSTLLAQIKRLFPEISRIILIAQDETKEMINILNESDAFIFLSKPFNNLALLNAVKRGAQRYNDKMKLKKLTPEVEEKSAAEEELKRELNAIKEQTHSLTSEIVVTLSQLIKPAQNLYFKDHTTDVVQMAKALGQRLELSKEEMTEIIFGGLIQSHYLIGLPDSYKVKNIYDLADAKEIAYFFNHFKTSLAYMKKIKVLSRYIEIAAMIFERMDGKGRPFSVSGIDIPKSTQVLIVCKIYHDLLYKLEEKDLLRLKFQGRVFQNRARTIERHQEAITYLYKRLKWFDHDLFYKFNDLIKKREGRAFKIPREDLVINYDKDHWGTPDFTGLNKSEIEIKLNHLRTTKVLVRNESGKDILQYNEYIANVNDLKELWELAEDIENEEGTLIAGKGTILEEDIIEKIQKLASNREISKLITVKKDEVSLED